MHNRADWALALRRILEEELVGLVAPGGVLAVARRGESGWQCAVAAAGTLEPRLAEPNQAEPVTTETIYDLASLTKPVVACVALGLAERSPGLLNEPLATFLPQLAAQPAAKTNLELLLSHRAGLIAHRELFAPLKTGGSVDYQASLELAADSFRGDFDAHPSQSYPAVYSDLGYLLAGAALEAYAHKTLEEQVTELAKSWQLDGTLTCARGLSDAATVAPTEDVDWRGGRVRRLVHDENAFALKGPGLCGHAGLFGDAACFLRFGATLLDCLHGSGPLSPGTLSRALTPRPGGSYLLGFDSRSSEGSSAGQRFSLASFGHLGFTGTSLWCDPRSDVAAVLLSNRVCPSRDNIAIRGARPRIHDRVHRLCTETSGSN